MSSKQARGMKSILPFLVIILWGCADDKISPDTKVVNLRQSTVVTWELAEIRNLTGEWREVSNAQKHFLTFLNDSTVAYSDATLTCTGQYSFNVLENSIPREQLILRVPCMVPAPQLWWEHAIELQTESEVVTYPQLNPLAYMTCERFKYKITHTIEP